LINLIHLFKDDEFVKKSFEKYTLKLCTVNVIDCFTDTCLKIFKSTPFDSTVVNLDENLKKKLNLITSSKSNNLRSSKLNIKRKTSRCLQRKSQLNAVDSVISEVSRRDSSVSNNEISTTLKTKRNILYSSFNIVNTDVLEQFKILLI
jgi:hypothetical protein